MGTYCFAANSKVEVGSLEIADDIGLSQLPGYMVENLIFDFSIFFTHYFTSLNGSLIERCEFLQHDSFFLKLHTAFLDVGAPCNRVLHSLRGRKIDHVAVSESS